MSRFSLSPDFSKRLLEGHSLLGVIFGGVIFLLCVSGTLAVLIDEFEIWEGPDGPVLTEASPELLAKVSQNAFIEAKKLNLQHDLFIYKPTLEQPRLYALAYDENRHERWYSDKDGNLTVARPTPWSEFLGEHHYNFHIPQPYGGFIVGLIGTILLASIVSGVFAHRRIFKDAFRLRLGGSRRLSSADIHNRIGVWALPFHFIVCLTGSLLGLAQVILMVTANVAYEGDTDKAMEALYGPHAIESHIEAPVPDIVPMIAQLKKMAPDATLNYVSFDHIGTDGQFVNLMTEEPGYLNYYEVWRFKEDGTFIYKSGYTDGNLGMRITGMVNPLHYGSYGGLPMKIIYLVLGSSLCVIVATGTNIWLARKRDQGYPAPQYERAWASLIWGQFAAFSLAAIAERLSLAPALPVFWFITLVPTVAVMFMETDRKQVSLFMKTAGGISALLLSIIHILTTDIYNIAVVGIDVSLVFLAVYLLRPLFKRLKPFTREAATAS